MMNYVANEHLTNLEDLDRRGSVEVSTIVSSDLFLNEIQRVREVCAQDSVECAVDMMGMFVDYYWGEDIDTMAFDEQERLMEIIEESFSCQTNI